MTTKLSLPSRRAVLGCGVLLAVPALPGLARANDPSRPLDVPYVPTPEAVVEEMMKLARVRAGDVLYDLGCGDGRVVVAAARRGARGVGIDLNPERIAEARANADKAGVAGRTRFVVGDLFEADVSPASVVTLYLLPEVNQRLRPRLWKQLKVGTRVVSHDFDMGDDWPPERTVEVERKTLYYWTIAARHKQA